MSLNRFEYVASPITGRDSASGSCSWTYALLVNVAQRTIVAGAHHMHTNRPSIRFRMFLHQKKAELPL